MRQPAQRAGQAADGNGNRNGARGSADWQTPVSVKPRRKSLAAESTPGGGMFPGQPAGRFTAPQREIDAQHVIPFDEDF